MASIILEFDRNPNLTDAERLQSFMESVQRAFNEFEITFDDLELEKHPLMVSVNKDNQDFRVMFKDYGEFKVVVANAIEAFKGNFKTIETEYLKASEAELGYVMIDKTNIDQAWIEELLVQGEFLASDVNSGTGSFSKWLTGVKIYGDDIVGGTISTERLIIRDPDNNTGILYEINNGIVAQENLSEEELKRLTLDGRIITAESITADKINVADLFAQNIMTTGDFNMGGKGALVYDKETDSLSLRAESIVIGKSSAATKEEVDSVKNSALIEAYDEYAVMADEITEPSEEDWSTNQPAAGEGRYIWRRHVSVYGNNDIVYGPAVCITGNKGDAGEAATTLRIESSRGTVFKNNAVSTVLSVVIYKGDKRITNITDLRAEYGATAYLEWRWQRMNEDQFGLIVSTDSRIGDDGFTFTLNPDDVDTKVTFLCNLIVD